MIKRKKGQITLFIILGLIILLVVSLTLYLKGEQITAKFDPELGKKVLIDQDITPLQQYIESCLTQVADPLVKEIANSGGMFEPVVYRYYQQQKVNYLCLDAATKENHCENTFLTQQDIEKELSNNINKKLDACIDLNLFKSQGFSIETEEKNTEVTIKDYEISIVLKYPLILKKDNLELQAETFSSTLNLDLGRLIKISNLIVNSELQEGSFDQIEFMKKHSDILINKHKPYPDIIYSVKSKNLIFNFALQGHDTISDVGYSYFGAQEQTGCCYNPQDNGCYKNTPAEICKAKQGLYDADNSCSCNEPELSETTAAQGKDCKEKKHLQAWCEYEGITDNGLDLVGSRHYRHYCVDGKEYVEECRDYREEYCGEDKKTEKAACTVNRWQDCISCNDETCCLDTNYRDCTWNPYETTNKCSPRIAPGFKFWGGNAIALCTRAHETKYCDGFSCSQQWIDQTALFCAKQGDCGNWRNSQGALTKFGFLNTDLGKKVDDAIYLDPKTVKKELQKKQLNSQFKTSRATNKPYAYQKALQAHTELLSSMMSYIDELATIEFTDFLNPFLGKPLINIKDIALCGIWQAPFGNNDCKKCNEDDNQLHPCTEYKCKSLGQLCEYEEKEGVPFCFSQTSNDNTPPMIAMPEDIIAPPFKIIEQTEKIEGEIITGYKITPALDPNELVTFNLATDEPTKCKLAFTPLPQFTDLPNVNPMNNQFMQKHSITLRIPESVVLPNKVRELLNITTVDQFTALILQPKEMLEQYKQRYKNALFLYKTFNGNDLTKIVDPLVNMLLENIKHLQKKIPFAKALIKNSLEKFDKNTYVFYLKCVDKAGNENTDNVYIEFSIDTTKNDTNAPYQVAVMPENNSLVSADKKQQKLKFYLNEFGVCNYDYENKEYNNMKYSFHCPTSKYDLSPQEGGSYECTAALDLNLTETTIYTKCKDHPETKEEYILKVKKDTVPQLIGLEENPYANITGKNEILFSLPMLANDITFVVAENNLQLTMFKEDNNICSYRVNGEEKIFEHCEKTDAIHLGTYLCRENIALAPDNKIEERRIRLSFTNTTKENSELIAISGNTIFINASSEDTFLISTNKTTTLAELQIKSIGTTGGCSINTTEMTNTMMFCKTGDETTICQQSMKTTDGASYEIICRVDNKNNFWKVPITCKDATPLLQNIQQESYVYTLKKSSPLEIIYYDPKGEINIHETALIIKTSESSEVLCSYKPKLGISYISIDKKNDTTFTKKLSNLAEGSNLIVVRCEDAYENNVEKEIEIFVI
ncbi:hypothetical protein HYY69_03210 [Candidatus Woesearchaeota archaeon]|nr:hypothetical protein [Candidatus Woesearchaeota archaeon]